MLSYWQDFSGTVLGRVDIDEGTPPLLRQIRRAAPGVTKVRLYHSFFSFLFSGLKFLPLFLSHPSPFVDRAYVPCEM